MSSAFCVSGITARLLHRAAGRARRGVLCAAGAAALGVACGPARAIDIDLVFYTEAPDAVDPCILGLQACGRTNDLALLMQAAADHWSAIYRDDHQITLRYYWTASGSPDASVLEFDALGRPTLARLRIPADGDWAYDADPASDEGYDMQVRLFRTTHPVERQESFQGDPPEVLEVGYIGNSTPLPDIDLLTVILHEMGHAIGLASNLTVTGPFPSCSAADPFFDIDPALTGGHHVRIGAFVAGGFDGGHLAVGGIEACKTDPEQSILSGDPSTFPPLTVRECTSHQALMYPLRYPSSRTRPSVVDILVIGRAAGWEEIHLPRKYPIVTDDDIWHDGGVWLGGRIPEPGDDVYVINQASDFTIRSFEPAAVDNLIISDGNRVEAFFWPFSVTDSIVVEGEGSAFVADLSSTVDAGSIQVGSGSTLGLGDAGVIRARLIENEGVITGGAGTIEVETLLNSGRIAAGWPDLTFIPASPTASFELAGTFGGAVIEAVIGDLAFLGPIAEQIVADVQVGPGYSITFLSGWTQGWSPFPSERLLLAGGAGEATIHGDSSLNGMVVVEGVGRFTSDVVIGSSAQLDLGIGGTMPGAGHDQVVIDGSLDVAGGGAGGALGVSLVGGFVPSINDRFTIVRHGPRTGAFAVADLPSLDGGLEFYLDYREDRIDLVVGFEGVDPGAPNCTGKATSSQAALHGSIPAAAAYHGFASVKAFMAAIDQACGG